MLYLRLNNTVLINELHKVSSQGPNLGPIASLNPGPIASLNPDAAPAPSLDSDTEKEPYHTMPEWQFSAVAFDVMSLMIDGAKV